MRFRELLVFKQTNREQIANVANLYAYSCELVRLSAEVAYDKNL